MLEEHWFLRGNNKFNFRGGSARLGEHVHVQHANKNPPTRECCEKRLIRLQINQSEYFLLRCIQKTQHSREGMNSFPDPAPGHQHRPENYQTIRLLVNGLFRALFLSSKGTVFELVQLGHGFMSWCRKGTISEQLGHCFRVGVVRALF